MLSPVAGVSVAGESPVPPDAATVKVTGALSNAVSSIRNVAVSLYSPGARVERYDAVSVITSEPSEASKSPESSVFS